MTSSQLGIMNFVHFGLKYTYMQPSYLQTKAWGQFKQSQGWRAHFLSGNILVLERNLPYLNKPMLYVPEVLLPKDPTDFLKELKELGNKQKAMFIRLELLNVRESEESSKIVKLLKRNKYTKSFEDVQPTWRQWVKISGNNEDILAQMKPKGRYNIKVANRHGLSVAMASGEQPSAQLLVERVHKLYLETAQRDGFSPRSLAYFRDLVKTLGQTTKVLVAHHNKKDLAGMILTLNGGYASYLYGASSNEERQLMAPYLLHFSAMQVARENKCKIYDLLAVAPPDQPNHNYAGLSRFKSQFGGETVEIMGSYDLILKPIWYKIFSLLEKKRRHK
jgi:lipid II:glycine glycyltransferase (peptidoglycan interpeptide bridge formation enzyme)